MGDLVREVKEGQTFRKHSEVEKKKNSNIGKEKLTENRMTQRSPTPRYIDTL